MRAAAHGNKAVVNGKQRLGLPPPLPQTPRVVIGVTQHRHNAEPSGLSHIHKAALIDEKR